jgi:hypothetical protein
VLELLLTLDRGQERQIWESMVVLKDLSLWRLFDLSVELDEATVLARLGLVASVGEVDVCNAYPD